MIDVKPQVFILAEPKLNEEGVWSWLRANGADPMKVMGRMTGSDAEKVVELAARRCYKSFEVGLNPNVTRIREHSGQYHENILKVAHGSVTEHANFTVAFEFVSRVFTHELVRHRAGAAYSQESLRYVRLTELGFWTPPEIASNEEANALFREAVEYLENCQHKLESIFHEALEGDFSEKKKLTSAFRRIAPEGLATGIVATFNTRALRHIFEKRTEGVAEVEIRLAIDMLCELLIPRHPYVFQDFSKEMVDGINQWKPRYSKI
jgi:thymidylate synthase (FAD)